MPPKLIVRQCQQFVKRYSLSVSTWAAFRSAPTASLEQLAPIFLMLDLFQFSPAHSIERYDASQLRQRQKHSLQWGHGISAVEMTRDCSHAEGLSHGFNGATAFQPWKWLLGKCAEDQHPWRTLRALVSRQQACAFIEPESPPF